MVAIINYIILTKQLDLLYHQSTHIYLTINGAFLKKNKNTTNTVNTIFAHPK